MGAATGGAYAQAPVISAQQYTGTWNLYVGSSFPIWVTASGAEPLSYQWRKNGVAMIGATAATLQFSSLQGTDEGTYDVVVANPAGSVTSLPVRMVITVALPPSITSQPVGGTVTVGGVSNFLVGVSSTANPYPFYQWRFNGVAISGATSQGYSIANTQLSHAGSYDVIVSNVGGAVTSQAVALVVVPPTPPTPPTPPSITGQPSSMTQFSGGAVSFSVIASGAPAPSYQWRKDGVAILNAVSPSLAFNNVQLAHAGVYDVIVANAGGTVTSAAATLTVTAPVTPTITSQPAGGTLNVTNLGSFRVAASGSSPLSYQWRKNGVPIAGAISDAFIVGFVTTADAGTYDVVISNVAGSVTSSSAVLGVNPAVVTFTSQPANAVTFVGGSAVMTIAADGSPSTPGFQWRKNGVAISGATNAALAFPSVQLSDAGSYDVVATNGLATATSASATLAVNNSAPQITVQPVGATLSVGGSTTLVVAVTGSMPVTYQWRRDGIALTSATSASLTIANAQTYDTGDYTVVVTNAAGSTTSLGAYLNIVPRVVAYSARLMLDADGALGVFTIEGTVAKKVLLRAVGPGLAPFGVTGLPDPQLELFDSSGALLAINNDWSSSADATVISSTTAAVGAFALAVGSRDAAIVRILPPGTYTARGMPASGAGGTGYLELYDADVGTSPMSTLPYLAVRGKMAAGGGVVIGGLGSNGRGQRSYLVRAIGPGLGLPGVLANPSMLIVRDGTLVGNNDDWDAVPADASVTSTSTTRVTAFALPAGGRDSALVLTGNLHVGACTVQVGGSDSLGGLVLLELHDLDVARPPNFAPVVASAPVSTTVAAGEAAMLKVLAHGTAPLNYQWRKDGVPIAGATAAILSLAAVQPASGGSYSVVVSNSLGSATSLLATVTVQGSGSGSAATHAVVGNGYVGGSTVTITNTLSYATTPTSLGWSVALPPGWSFVSDGGTVGDIKPIVGATGTLGWAWTAPPVAPVTFTYTLSVPAGTTGLQMISAGGIVRVDGSVSQPGATPSPLMIQQLTNHSVDTNADYRVSLVELTRVIELYNTRNGTTRTGCYAVAAAVTEDGFAIDSIRAGTAVVTLARYHSGDSDRNAKLSLFELTRMIEFYNTRTGTVRTGQYHVQAGTEDGFAPGL